MAKKPGRYDKLEKIGQGTFSEVYRARDTVLDRPVALKKMKSTLLADPVWVKRFYQEAKTIARLDHPNIVAIYDVTEANDQIFIVMRLVKGPSLQTLISTQRKLSWPETLKVISTVAAGLDHAHAHNVLHRDLKPANILIDPERGAMLTDFGLAKLAEEATTSQTSGGDIVGTAQYMAPEVWDGRNATPKSDIYALGCIVYDMLVGESIFKGNTPPAIMIAHFRPLALPATWPAGIPPGINNVIETALHKTPGSRYTTAQDMLKALSSLTPEALEPSAKKDVDALATDVKKDTPLQKLYLFGTPRFEFRGQAVKLRGRKVMALAAYLAVEKRMHTRDHLAALLWPEHNQTSARANLRRELSRLNKTFGEDTLAIDRESVEINPNAPLWLDVDQFQQHLAAGKTHPYPANEICPDCIVHLTRAVACFTDDFLAGFSLADSPAFDEWQFFQNETLRRQLAEALEKLITGHTSRQEFEPAITYARQHLALDPLHEPAHRNLMQLYAQANQQAAARRQYEECTRVLQEEMGVAPHPETTTLHERIQRGEIERRLAYQEDTPISGVAHPVTTPATAPHNVPAALTPLVGRNAELQTLAQMITQPQTRLITILGPAGIGKTHLALETANQQRDSYPHGVYFVPLASLEEAGQIAAAIANAINFSFYEEALPEQQLLAYLRPKEILLVLDNFEHLLDGGAFVVEMLKTAPHLKIVITSQIRLNIQEEQLLTLPGMDVPEFQDVPKDASRFSAVEMFFQCARRVYPNFEVGPKDMQAIVKICQLMHGMPLGILLASAWVTVLAPQEIAAEIEQNLDFLETDLQNVPARQRSIRAVFNSIWQLLTKKEKSVFARLSIFKGGFNREAAQYVAAPTLKDLMSLTNKSLLFRTSGGRYEAHGLLKQYAAEKLSQLPETDPEQLQGRYAAFYTEMLHSYQTDLRSGKQQQALASLEADLENIRAAWTWAHTNGQVALVAQAANSLFHFFDMRSRFLEGADIFEKANRNLAALNKTTKDQQATLDITLGRVIARQGWFLFQLGQHAQAETLLRHSLKLLQRRSKERGANPVFSLNYLAAVQGHLGKYSNAETLARQAVDICRNGEDQFNLSIALNVLGQVALAQGNYPEAQTFCRESLAIARSLNHRWGIAFSLTNLGQVAYALSDYAEARKFFYESMAIRRKINDLRGIAIGLNNLGKVSLAEENYSQACQQHKESLAIFNEIGNQWGQATSLIMLAEVALNEELFDNAAKYLHQALQTAAEIQATPLLLNALVGISGMMVKQGNLEHALEILALVMNHPHCRREQQDKAASLLAKAAKTDLPANVLSLAQQRGRNQDLDKMVSELLNGAILL